MVQAAPVPGVAGVHDAFRRYARKSLGGMSGMTDTTLAMQRPDASHPT